MFYFSRVSLNYRIVHAVHALPFLICCFINMSSPPALLAEQSFQWIDKAGNTVYGSKPPAGARDVKEFKTRALSTYSSETAISRMEPEIMEEDFSSDSPDNSAGTISSTDIQQKDELQPGLVQKTILNNESTPSYSVEIRNPGTQMAKDIKVTFRFSDANIVVANGPSILGPKDVATYTVPALLVPVANTEAADKEEGKTGEDILPEVEISYDLTL